MTSLSWGGAPPAQASASEGSAAPSAQESIPLESGKPVEREISGGQSHFYKVTMTSGQYLRITVSPQGIDVLVALFTPDDKKIGEVNSVQSAVRSEAISAIAEATGAYRIKVRSANKTTQTGRYEISVEELREATAEDKYRFVAGSLYREAEQLRQGTLEERRKGVDSSLLKRERSLQQLLNAKAAAQFALLKDKHTSAQAEAAAKEIDSIY